jgi:acyl-CoA thioester hydrolase
MTKAAPFLSSPMRVIEDWIDYNGHMNMAYYNVLFDRCADEIYSELGVGPDYLKARGHTTYTGEFHICYLRELKLGDTVRVSCQLVDFDDKRFHTFQEIIHEDGWIAASGEALALHIDMSGPRVAPFPADIRANFERLMTRHAGLPRPGRVGRAIGIRRP